MKYHFIVGMSRAGTTWLAKTLNAHADVAAFGETAFWGRQYLAPAADGRYNPAQLQELLEFHRRLPHSTAGEGDAGRSQPGCFKSLTQDTYDALMDRVFSELPPRPTPAEVFTAMARGVAEAEGKTVAVEKTPHHINWVDRIADALPHSKFIVMVRQPYDFVLSYKHQGDRYSGAVRAVFDRLYHPIACALVWRGYVRSATDIAARHPDRVRLVYFEDLRTSPAETIEGVLSFLQLDPNGLTETVPPDNSSFPRGKRPALNAADLFWLNLVAREEIRQLTVPVRPTPWEPLQIAWSAAVFPCWGRAKSLCSAAVLACALELSRTLAASEPPTFALAQEHADDLDSTARHGRRSENN